MCKWSAVRRYPALIFLLFLFAGFIVPTETTAQEGEVADIPKVAKTGADRQSAAPFPFRAYAGDGEYDLQIDLNDPEVKRRYKTMFRKHHLPYNAGSFEDIVLHAVSADPALELVIITEASADKLLIGTGNPLYRKNLLKMLQPVLRDEAGFDKFMQSMQEE